MAYTFRVCLLALVVRIAMCNVLGKSVESRPLVMSAFARTRDVRQSLADVLKLALNKGNAITDVRLDRLKSQLKPLFAALPKNSKGRLGHSTVRYALHRHFEHQHGMYVRGLEPAGEAWNSSSPVAIMEDRVPDFVQHLFEERLHDGFDLDDLGLLAAAMEHFVHNEASERLLTAYKLTDNSAAGPLSSQALERVVDAYMILFIADGGDRDISDATRKKMVQSPERVFPTWSKTQVWLRGIQEDVLEQEQMDQTAVTFDGAFKIVQATLERYGKYQNADCVEMAKALTAKEEKGTGRVQLRNFYTAGWQFKETEDYLEQIGALDRQFQPANGPWVVIPNYVASTTNCVASSSIYSVCCMNPCETILRHLEMRLVAPSATPEDLVRLVSTIPSATVEAPRSLSMTLVSRLASIAEAHNGRVPLHGRLFAQWLHNAYPHECVYPMVSGTTHPMSAEDWMKSRNQRTSVSQGDLDQLLAKDVKEVVVDKVDGDVEETLPWDSQEELVDSDPKPTLTYEIQVVTRAVMLFGLLYAFANLMASYVGPLVATYFRSSKHQYHAC